MRVYDDRTGKLLRIECDECERLLLPGPDILERGLGWKIHGVTHPPPGGSTITSVHCPDHRCRACDP